MAASRGSLCIYDETNTLVYKQMASSGDYVSTVTLQGNKLTFSVTSENTVVYVTDNDEILTNTKNITVVSTPVGAVTQTVITLPIEPSTVKLATGTSEIDEYSGYIELAQGETKTTAYGAGMNTGGGAVIYYTSGGGGSTLTFKHFFDSGTIGTGTVKFRHYSQQEPSSGETWVLNENAYKATNNFTYTANFVCDGTNYTTIVNSNNPKTGGLFYDTTQVVHPDYASQFVNEKYRTITFAIPPTGDLLTWLQANGTKQGGTTLINFTINGTAYQAEEGMTWQEWVNSSYNTYGCTIEGSSVKGKGNNGSPTYIYINQNSSLTLVSSTDSIIKNATYEDAAGGAGN